MDKNIKLSVIICTYNRADLLGGCLQCLADQTLDKALYEVIVVNNNSTDNTQRIAEEFARTQPNFRVINETKQGLSHARNRGYKDSLGNYIAYIDDDARALSDWIELILTAFETTKPMPVAVGGKYLPWYKGLQPSWFTDELEIRTWGDDKGFLQPPRAQHGFSGSNMAFLKSTLQAYNGFSSSYGKDGNKLRLGEETELFNRIYKDYPLFWYDPRIIVKHLVPENNMTIRYRLRRAYWEGVASAGISIDPKGTRTPAYMRLRYIFSLLHYGYYKRNWKLYLLKYAEFLARVLGYLKRKIVFINLSQGKTLS